MYTFSDYRNPNPKSNQTPHSLYSSVQCHCVLTLGSKNVNHYKTVYLLQIQTFRRILQARQSGLDKIAATFRLAALPPAVARIPASAEAAFSCHLSRLLAASYLVHALGM